MKLITEIIMIITGVYMTLIGFRVISASKKEGPEYEQWYNKWGSRFKILGPLLVVIGLLMMFVLNL